MTDLENKQVSASEAAGETVQVADAAQIEDAAQGMDAKPTEAASGASKPATMVGKPADGNTVCDYDAEEIKRQVTISAAIAPISFFNYSQNVLFRLFRYVLSTDNTLLFCRRKKTLQTAPKFLFVFSESLRYN